MNKTVTSKEALLDAAQQIVFQEGIEKLSIRHLANHLHISTGVVYNYFPSKSELILAIIENFWKHIFHKDICRQSEQLSFPDFYELVYLRLAQHMEEFFSVLLGQLNLLRDQDKEKGKQLEQKYFLHIQQGFLYALHHDSNIDDRIWNENFTKEAFITFLFETMMNDLSHQRNDCRYTKEMIQRLLQYPTNHKGEHQQ